MNVTSQLSRSGMALMPLLALGLISGCISSPPANNLPAAPQNIAPTLTPAPVLDAYRLQIGDVVDVRLMYNPELNDEVTVQPDGMISTSVVQNVPAYGRTTGDLQGELQTLYENELTKPHITIILRSFAPSRVYVTGEVNTPGEFITIGPNLTLVQAIARAGGMKNDARPGEIVILRRGAGETPLAYRADYNGAVTGASPASDVRLEPYDVVYVPRSDIGDAYLYFQQYIQQFVPSSFGLSYNLNPIVSTK
jgi:polysaccharide export outer membrane protein